MADDKKSSPMEAVLGKPEAKKAETKEVATKAEPLPSVKYLTIVNYTGGQIDNSLVSTVILNPDQFLYAYEEEDLGFTFKEFDRPLSSQFTVANIAKVLRTDENEDEVIDALYNLSDFGFADADGEPDQYRFLKRLTGQDVENSSKADPRMFN